MITPVQLRQLGVLHAFGVVWRQLVLLSIVALLTVGLGILKPVVFSELIDEGLLPKDWQALKAKCILLLLVGVCGAACGFAHSALSSVIANRVVTVVRATLLDRLADLGSGFFGSTSTGDIATRVNSDSEQVQNFLMSILNMTLMNLLSFGAAMTYIGFVEWRMLLVGFLVAPLVGSCMHLLRNKILSSQLSTRELQSECNQRVIPVVDRMAYLRQISADRERSCRVKTCFRNLQRANVRRDLWLSGSISLTSVSTTIGYVLMVGYGGWLVIGGTLSLGHLFAFLTMRSQFTAPVTLFEQAYRYYLQGKASIERLLQFYQHPIESGIQLDAPVPKGISFAQLEVKDMMFGYGPSQIVFKGLSCTFSKGWNIVRGRNGSGKTTLIGLLLKITSAGVGSIQIDGFDIAKINNRCWRSCVGVVPQHTYLFEDSLRENVRLYDVRVSDSEIRRVLDVVRFPAEPEALPEGLDTRLTDGGLTLSGGQRQKVAIARAILRDSPIYIFDEALVHIDSGSRGLILSALKSELKGKIIIWVTHDMYGNLGETKLRIGETQNMNSNGH